jgi:hypothetical protein
MACPAGRKEDGAPTGAFFRLTGLFEPIYVQAFGYLLRATNTSTNSAGECK